MVNFKKSKNILSGLALAFLICAPARTQQQDEGARRTSDQSRNQYGVDQTPDLSQENLGRVAASATQIRAVLSRDEGLLVELKRWVAKEATDNGQVVEDSSLTDQAIFERLDRDVVFRSVATRLVQRFGYLTPALNPDSDFAKEQDLILKERARRLVAIEGQEDAEAMQPKKPEESDKAKTDLDCDRRDDENCDDRESLRRRRRRMQDRDQYPDNPGSM